MKPHPIVVAAVTMLTSCSLGPPIEPPTPLPAPVKAYQANAVARADAVWNRLLSPRAMDNLSTGTVKVAFYIARDGRVQNLRVVSNTGNQALAELAIRTIQETRMPPIPPTVVATLAKGQMSVVYDFTIHE